MTVKDIILRAYYMLNMTTEAYDLESGITVGTIVTFVKYFNLVYNEVQTEYLVEGDCESFIEYTLTDEIEPLYGISERVLAYGVAAEYCITIANADAPLWDKRYKDALAMERKKSRRVRARKFMD